MKVKCTNCSKEYDSELGMCPYCGYVEGEHSEEEAHINPGEKISKAKWPLWVKILASVVAVAVIAVIVLLLTGVIGSDSKLQTENTLPDGMARVPSVVEADMDTAGERLTAENLLYLIEGAGYSDMIPSDCVLTQDIAGGTVVLQNTVVGLTVSKGAETAFIEDVTLMDKDEATSIMEDAGFDVDINTVYNKVIAEGSVISQSDEKDTELVVGSTVVLTVSAGPEDEVDAESTLVPDFSGMTYDEVITEAENAGVMVAVVEKTYTGEDDAGAVLSQSVEAGEQVSTGTVVELTTSMGEEYVRTPDVQYESEEDAAADLAGLDVQVEYEESTTVKEGHVISQSIDAGEKVAPDEEITITVSIGTPVIAMPDVTDTNIDEAKSTLNGYGLVVYISYEQDDTVDEGTVLDQSIAAGEAVSTGDEVTLTVSTKDTVVYVAGVVGESAGDADKTLTDQGFKVIFADISGEAVSDSADENLTVISQLPTAGSGQKADSSVVVTVAETTGTALNGDEKDDVEQGDEEQEQENEEEPEEDNEETNQDKLLAEGTCGENLTWTLDIDGVLTISGTGEMEGLYMEDDEVSWRPYDKTIETVIIEDGVTSIGNYAFYWCKYLTNITIPDSVTSIGDYAFSGCDSLVSITLTDNVITIGENAFGYCNSMTSIIIPQNVTKIEKNAFSGWTASQTVNISGYSKTPFYWNDNWSEGCEANIVWDEEDQEIQTAETSGTCGENLTWALDDGLLTISGTGAMDDYTDESEVPWYLYGESINEVVIEEGVTSIGNFAFCNCDLTQITMPDGVLSIGDYAFCDCFQLTNATIPDGVTSIGKYAFSYCRNLSCIIPDSVTSIGDGAFSGYNPYDVMTIPKNVTYLGYRVFGGWSEYTSIYIEGYASTPSEWNTGWVYDCNSHIIWDEEVQEGQNDDINGICGDNLIWTIDEEGLLTISGTGSMYDYTSERETPWYAYNGTITSILVEEGVTSVGDYAFSGCDNYSLNSITLPDGVTSIGDAAFLGCEHLWDIIIPDSVTSIGRIAFFGCYFMNITIPESVESIGTGAFYDWNKGAYDDYDSNQIIYGAQSDWDSNWLFGCYATIVWDEASWETNHIIANAADLAWVLSDEGVLTISGTGCFGSEYGSSEWSSCGEYIKSVVIEEEVTYIGYCAFSGCSNLTSVSIPDCVTSISERAFSGCTGLTSIEIPDSVTSIGNSAFYGCTGLTSIEIPDSVTSIGNSAFFDCTGLTSITISDSVTYIGDSVFSYCTGVTSITIPASVTKTGFGIFSGWTSSQTIYIEGYAKAPSGWSSSWDTSTDAIIVWDESGIEASGTCGDDLTWTLDGEGLLIISGTGEMDDYYGKSSEIPWLSYNQTIKNVFIEDGVTSIGGWAFMDCSSLTSVSIPDSVASIGKFTFTDCCGITSITIPDSVTQMDVCVFYGWTSSQTIYVKTYTEAPSDWITNYVLNRAGRGERQPITADWNSYCDATIVWGQ